ncbi:MAG: zinc-binding alcohol dehydrogenase [Chloroflexota bacterium]|nr:zinc-binding alcohol dehydrogenase [Chloroflexota bacterium]
MKIQSLVFPGKDQCLVEATTIPDNPGTGEVLIRNRLSLISAGTELAMFTETHRGFAEADFSYASYPFRPGYAVVGEVVAAGDGVSDLAPGTRVFHRSRHATHALLSHDVVLPVPEGVPDSHVPFIAMLQIAMSAPRQAPVYFGENVLVIGMGLVGNLCAQLCASAGAGRVAAADLAAPRLAQALACGADVVFDLSEKPLADWLPEFGPRGANYVVEAVGSGPTIDLALKAAARHGRVVLLGSPRDKLELDPYFDIHRTGVHVIGAHASTVDAATREQDMPFLWSLLATGRINVEPLISHVLPYTEGQKAYEGLRDRKDEFLGVLLEYPED